MQEAQPFLNVLVENLFPVIASLVLATLPVLLEAFRRYLKAKYNFEVSQAVIDRYGEFVFDGIHWMEEQTRKKEKAGEAPTPSAEKLDGTLAFVVSAAKAAGLPAWGEEEIKKLIESVLNQTR